jgi:hypothetical protein
MTASLMPSGVTAVLEVLVGLRVFTSVNLYARVSLASRRVILRGKSLGQKMDANLYPQVEDELLRFRLRC